MRIMLGFSSEVKLCESLKGITQLHISLTRMYSCVHCLIEWFVVRMLLL
jgi:hypothetical protein